MTGRKMEVLSWRTPPHVLAIESMTAHSSIAQLCIFSRTLGGGWHNFDAKMHIFQQEVPRFRCGDLHMKLLMWPAITILTFDCRLVAHGPEANAGIHSSL